MARPDDAPAHEPQLAGPDGWDRATWLWLFGIGTLTAVLVLLGLEGGELRVHDEGLYGQLARNALHHDRYLYAVGADGEFYETFNKPPLTLLTVAASFRALGVSMFALRLPFALSMLGLVLVSFAWGRRIGGLSFAVGWAGALASCEATFRWGRSACIEPMLVLWIMAALWAYHEATVRTGRRAMAWALGCGVALALAFATKQVVVAIGVVPIVALEVWRWQWRQSWRRLVLVLAVPTVTAVVWIVAMLRVLGDKAIEVYFETAVLQRMEGYETGSLARTLNELSAVVVDAAAPFPWVLGVAGVVLLALARPHARREVDAAWLLPLWLLSAVLVFENLSGSMLPWYAFDLIPPLAGGIGFCVAAVAHPEPGRLGLSRASVGAVGLGLAAIAALEGWVSQLNAAIVAAVAVVVLWRMAQSPAHAATARRGRGGLVLLAALAIVAAALDRPELRRPPEGHEQLMRALAERGVTRVHVDQDTGLSGPHAWATYYGPQAQWVEHPPWRRNNDAQAYVTGTLWPEEMTPTNGCELLRVPGAIAVVGPLGTAPTASASLEQLLDAGPISFEAEHGSSQRLGTVRVDPAARGGHARAVIPRRGHAEPAFVLSHGVGARLARGLYTATFELRSDCGDIVERPAAVVQVLGGGQVLRRATLHCDGHGSGAYEPFAVDFRVPRTATVDLRVQYFEGELWHDRTLIVRRGSPSPAEDD